MRKKQPDVTPRVKNAEDPVDPPPPPTFLDTHANKLYVASGVVGAVVADVVLRLVF